MRSFCDLLYLKKGAIQGHVHLWHRWAEIWQIPVYYRIRNQLITQNSRLRRRCGLHHIGSRQFGSFKLGLHPPLQYKMVWVNIQTNGPCVSTRIISFHEKTPTSACLIHGTIVNWPDHTLGKVGWRQNILTPSSGLAGFMRTALIGAWTFPHSMRWIK